MHYRLVKFLQQCDNNALAPQRRDTIPMFFGQILQITNASCSEHIFFYPSWSAERALGGGRENKGLYENAFCKRCSIAAFPGRNMSCEISNVQTYKCGNFKDYYQQRFPVFQILPEKNE